MGRRTTTAAATIEIDVDADDGAPSGAITPDRGPVRRFSGWIELAGAIEDWRAEERDRLVEAEAEAAGQDVAPESRAE